MKNRSEGISYKVLPPYNEHEDFVKNNPYRKWFIINKDSKPIGTIYLQYDNSIGINVINPSGILIYECINIVSSICSPLKEKASLRPGHFYINSSYQDEMFIKSLKSIGWEPFQISFKLNEGN